MRLESSKSSDDVEEETEIPQIREMSEIDIQVQAQEHVYRTTLMKEKDKSGKHALEEVGRSLNAIAQRRRQYFLEYKNCDSIRCVRQWFAWEAKRNAETNAAESRENAATRGVKMFLHRIDFYGTLLTRFVEYILRPLQTHYATAHAGNQDLESVRHEMRQLKVKCEKLLSDSNSIVLNNVNHSEAEKRFPVISAIPAIHDTLHNMVMLSFQWRLHARFEQQFENIEDRRKLVDSERDLNNKKKVLRSVEHQMRRTVRGRDLLAEEIASRQHAITTSNFSEVYTQCTDQIDLISKTLESCQANIQSTDSAIKSVQQSFGKYKIVGPKRKQKLESSIIKRTKKVEELNKLKAELDRLENQKSLLDEEEVTWLRGGYDNEVGIIETLKEQRTTLEGNLADLEKERNDLKLSYDDAMEQLMRLSAEYDQLIHKYEYVKRLSSILVKSFWNNIDQKVSIKPNKITVNRAESENAYDMTQPKGVAMVICNDWTIKSPRQQQKGGVESKHDIGKVFDTLCIQLGYYLIHRDNLSAAAMKSNVIGLSDQYHGYSGSHNSLLLVVVAQANESGHVVAQDGGVVRIGEFLQHFANVRCPALIDKPKVFLFILRVTIREPVLPSALHATKKRHNTSLFGDDGPVYFEPEPVKVDDDCLVARIMFEDDVTNDGGPTFGGIQSLTDEGQTPWFVETMTRAMADQVGNADVLTMLRNIKADFADHLRTPRSDGNSNNSQMSSLIPKSSRKEAHVNLFVDQKLTRKFYFMPGI